MQSNDVRIIRGAALLAAVALVPAVALGVVAAGLDGAVGVAIGAVLATAFFGLGQVALVRAGRRWPELFLGVGFLVYTTQIGLLMGLLLLLRDATFLNERAFGAGVLVGAIAWLVGQTRAAFRSRTPYVEPVSDAAPAKSGAASGASPDGRP
ncbi:hypothetical protein ACTWP5_13895 [Streptomyces sp. 4N509B]|uniref:hypothetical protein n=1 Tax=Streptomyces sp. 4N509B TaxID=3457413 RepID=UPI003FD43AF3